MKSKRGHKLFDFFVVYLIIGILISMSFHQSKYSLTCVSYKFQTDKIQKPVRIVQITDLHNS